MTEIVRSISSLVNNEYREYSKYTVYHRAIPNLVDGFKPSQRKAFYVVPITSDFKKVQSVAGRMISDAEYNHGDASASAAISKMAQDFPGSNNIPVFSKKGSFGSRFIREPAQPRYIYVKPNKQFYSLFKDKELCPQNNKDENPEPEYYLPVIPTIMLNGMSGIAVGFASEIQPYNINDIINNIKIILSDSQQPNMRPMIPYFGDFIGKVEFDENKMRFVQYGEYEIVNTTTINITELPTIHTREKYKEILTKLVENKHITSFEINEKKRNKKKESNNRWNITIRLPRVSKVFKDPVKWLKLSATLTENLTVINEVGQIVVFDNVYDLLKHFVKFRLEIYRKRIVFMMENIKSEALLCSSKIRFINEMSVKDFKNLKKSELESYFKNLSGFNYDHIEKCFDIKTFNLNADYINQLKKKIIDLKKEFEYYKTIKPEELYIIDLDEIEKIFK